MNQSSIIALREKHEKFFKSHKNESVKVRIHKKEIKYFLNNVGRFGFDFLGIDRKKTKLF